MLKALLQAPQMCANLSSVWIMLAIVFSMLISGCAAQLGYQYQQSNYVTPAFNNDLEQLQLPPQPHDSYTTQSSDHFQAHADFHKHFYAFEAPYDSSEESERVERKLAALSQKNLQVVFIKAPENKALEGALNAYANQAGEDKTAIYVLNKQADADELASKLSALRTQHKPKPEVHFVKYRTDAEAAQAQQHIQAQYGEAVSSQAQPQPSPLSQPGYLPSLPNYGAALPTYYGAAAASAALPLPDAAVQGLVHLPPLPLPQQQLGPSSYELQSNHVDYRLNERQRHGSRMIFHKPKSEVNFVKYRTDAEAALAQQRIQAQYGGTVSGQVQPQPSPLSQPGYLPNYSATPPAFYGAAAVSAPLPLPDAAAQGLIDLPPLPFPQQQLGPSSYELQSNHVDYRLNERQRHSSRMIFPTDNEVPSPGESYFPPSNGYLPPQSINNAYLPTLPETNSYLPPAKRRRRAYL